MAGKKLSMTNSMETEVDTNTPVDVVDIDLSVVAKKKFRIDGDNNKIIELNTSDLGIIDRLNSAMKDLNELTDSASMSTAEIDPEDESSIESVAEALREIDTKMCEKIDYIFNSPVSKKCADGGTMYDLFNGSFRWEHIIDRLMKLYEDNLQAEFKQMKKRIAKHTAKYTR